MAYGFGATVGTAWTDKIVTANTAAVPSVFTLSLNFKLSGANYNSGIGYLLAKASTSGVVDCAVQYSGTTWEVSRGGGGETGTAYWTWALDTVSWHNLIVAWDTTGTANLPSVYFDGVVQSLTGTSGVAIPTDTSGSAWTIGNSNHSGDGNSVNGAIADVGIWGRLLSAGEIASLSQLFAPSTVHTPTLCVPLIRNLYNVSGGAKPVATGTKLVAPHPPTKYRGRGRSALSVAVAPVTPGASTAAGQGAVALSGVQITIGATSVAGHGLVALLGAEVKAGPVTTAGHGAAAASGAQVRVAGGGLTGHGAAAASGVRVAGHALPAVGQGTAALGGARVTQEFVSAAGHGAAAAFGAQVRGSASFAVGHGAAAAFGGQVRLGAGALTTGRATVSASSAQVRSGGGVVAGRGATAAAATQVTAGRTVSVGKGMAFFAVPGSQSHAGGGGGGGGGIVRLYVGQYTGTGFVLVLGGAGGAGVGAGLAGAAGASGFVTR